MDPIQSAPTIRYNSAPPQQVTRKLIRNNPYWFVSCANIVVPYEMLPKIVCMYVIRTLPATHWVTLERFLYWMYKNDPA